MIHYRMEDEKAANLARSLGNSPHTLLRWLRGTSIGSHETPTEVSFTDYGDTKDGFWIETEWYHATFVVKRIDISLSLS